MAADGGLLVLLKLVVKSISDNLNDTLRYALSVVSHLILKEEYKREFYQQKGLLVLIGLAKRDLVKDEKLAQMVISVLKELVLSTNDKDLETEIVAQLGKLGSILILASILKDHLANEEVVLNILAILYRLLKVPELKDQFVSSRDNITTIGLILSQHSRQSIRASCTAVIARITASNPEVSK